MESIAKARYAVDLLGSSDQFRRWEARIALIWSCVVAWCHLGSRVRRNHKAPPSGVLRYAAALWFTLLPGLIMPD